MTFEEWTELHSIDHERTDYSIGLARMAWAAGARSGRVGVETKTVMMPRELTNADRPALMGKFSIPFPVACSCMGELNTCEICGGKGEYMRSINVPWKTIEEIYGSIVKQLGV